MSQHATRSQDFKTIEILSLNDTQRSWSFRSSNKIEWLKQTLDWSLQTYIGHNNPQLAIIVLKWP
jgi:hypothetical protein